MSDFRQIFLADSVNNLTSLLRENAENRREAFRIIHTVKGGAQTFGLRNAARLAEKLEDILSKSDGAIDKNLLREGIERLIENLQTNEFDSSAEFLEKLDNSVQIKNTTDIFLTRFPPKVFQNLAETEQNALISGLRQKKNIYCVEPVFELSNFAGEYRNLRKILSENGEIIAALPSAKPQAAGKIGFQIFTANDANPEDLCELLEDFDTEISAYGSAESESGELFAMLSQIAAHGATVAEKSGKEIVFSVLASDARLSVDTIKTLFDVLLHLVRNAVDHAVEQIGKIEIRLFETEEGLFLSVADDGKGVDLERVRARARSKNLISADDLPDERQTLELIFASELSTAETVSEISGRGVGLDAVKSAVEKSNGKISVHRRKTNGTIFKVFLPKL